LPILHKSSYEIKRQDVRVPVEEDEAVLFGFREQAARVCVGVEAIVERGLKEGTNLVVEGVHLVPEIIPQRYLEHPNVCTLVVHLSDEHVHRSRFYIRAWARRCGGRPRST
jgi:2-phosphoglycerate kinase